MKRILACLALQFGASLAWADFHEGLEAAERGDYKSALALWQQSAAEGDALAQYNIGVLHENGKGTDICHEKAALWYRKAAERGVEQNPVQAAEWTRQAALQGNVEAQYNVALKYDKGIGVTRDYRQAVSWYRNAAEQGHREAQYNLAGMYDSGQGIAKNNRYALDWYRKAAEQGNPDAQFNLGMMYVGGEGVPRDPIQAYKWFSIAAANGVEAAPFNRKQAARILSRQQVERAQALADQWLEQRDPVGRTR
ncbi:MAG: tetratricopeptide repeat protein [Noviherbaspirillum sp.]